MRGGEARLTQRHAPASHAVHHHSVGVSQLHDRASSVIPLDALQHPLERGPLRRIDLRRLPPPPACVG